MPPPCVLLERRVNSLAPGAAVFGDKAKGKEAAAVIRGKGKTMKPNLAVSHPPDVTYLSMVRQTPLCGNISSTDKALAVLCTDDFNPEVSRGRHVVYDASSNSLSVIPRIPYSRKHRINILGTSAAILSRWEGTYVLAELFTRSKFPNAALYLFWSPTENQQGQWIRKPVRLPFVPNYLFFIDMTFSYNESSVCWIDLLQGVLICDVLTPSEPDFRFIPLPEGYLIDVTNRRRPRPHEFRTMGCVLGVVKFVTLVGFYENNPSSEIMLKTWTLSHDLKEWTAGSWRSMGEREFS